ncbi:glucose 1-dehydrogenase [Adhaeribacter swui]|uniref:Glucose 1-dehydrogenase n=1 Tax=Adhaeribacter swui TaxID=2086471 RepID=A0A7G7G4T1_9BACT|nr:glucose 1-dehydrogenase [Adhaeribacter swui]QNF32165.1 glucose 1-dehydrogenase [Adhaeribacter swui]
MALFDLTGKTAVVTGGGSGIGKSISHLFAQQGAHVYILELNAEAGEETIREITEAGGKATLRPCNVAKQAEVLEVFAGIEQKAGTIDILINNAGIAHVGNLENTAEADIDRIYSVNIKGMYNCMLAAVQIMKKANKGVITNMASVAGSLGIPDRFAYSMSKGAVIAMTYSVARDYLTSNIRCNCISPGRVHTPFVDGFIAKNYPGREQEMFEKLSKTQPIGRMGTPNEIAHLALYLSSEEASFITGTDYPIDGGFITLNS